MNEQLKREDKNKLKNLINSFDSIFSKHEFDLGHNDTHSFAIDTGNAKPKLESLGKTI